APTDTPEASAAGFGLCGVRRLLRRDRLGHRLPPSFARTTILLFRQRRSPEFPRDFSERRRAAQGPAGGASDGPERVQAVRIGTGPMGRPPLTILLAAPRGFCAGVDRAVQIVEKALEAYGAPVYVRHEIVHNRFVVESLEAK